MNYKPGLELAAQWWRKIRLFYSPGSETLVVELPDRTTRSYRDVPAQVYELLQQSPEVRGTPKAGRRYSILEA
jgi:hypothetical protein